MKGGIFIASHFTIFQMVVTHKQASHEFVPNVFFSEDHFQCFPMCHVREGTPTGLAIVVTNMLTIRNRVSR